MNKIHTKDFKDLTIAELINMTIDGFFALEDIKDDPDIPEEQRTEEARFENMQASMEADLEFDYGVHPFIFVMDYKDKSQNYIDFMIEVSKNINERNISKQIVVELPDPNKKSEKPRYLIVVNFDI